MGLSQAQARDDIMARLKAAVDANAAGTPIRWEDVAIDEGNAAVDARIPELRAFIKFASGDQLTLGGVGSRRFTRAGVVIVQVLTPPGDGFTLADVLATVARNAFEGVSTPNGVWFRKVAVKSIGKTGSFQQTNVTANFEYTEQR